MNYGIYKNARNASWQCLIDCNVIQLPVNPIVIAANYGIKCKFANAKTLKGASGKIRKNLTGAITILCDEAQPKTRQAFTITHELGHYLLGHLGDTPLSRSENDCRPKEEYAAERFAADMLMPACVLWALNIHTADDIAKLCNVSMQAAQIRAERMEILYQRNMFLSHPLERQVYQQFQKFINDNR